MAKTGDKPTKKPKARAARPSFTPAAVPAASSAWVYRSDAPAPAVVKAAPARRQRTLPAAVPEPRVSRVTHALDVLTLPIALSLLALLAPVRWLLGPSSRP